MAIHPASAGGGPQITGAIRQAELTASAIASRALAGDPTPCDPLPKVAETCHVDDGVATVRIVLDGFRASAIAGPER